MYFLHRRRSGHRRHREALLVAVGLHDRVVGHLGVDLELGGSVEASPSLVDTVVEDGEQNAQDDQSQKTDCNPSARRGVGGHSCARDDKADERNNDENN